MRFGVKARIFATIIVALGIPFYLLWRKAQPKVELASLTELKGLCPNLIVEDVKDSSAIARLDQLVDACKLFSKNDLQQISDHGLPNQKRLDVANKFFSPTQIGSFLMAIDAGSVQLYNPKPNDLQIETLPGFAIVDDLRLLERSLAGAISLYLDSGNSERATDCLLIAIRFIDRIWEMRGKTLIVYLVLTGSDNVVSRAVYTFAHHPNARIEDCERVLREYGAAPRYDSALSEAVKREFTKVTLPSVENPFVGFGKNRAARADEPDYWQVDPTVDRLTFSSIETAKTMANLIEIELKNNHRPYINRDSSSRKIRDEAGKNLPQTPGKDFSGPMRRLAWFQFIFKANQIPNYYGRLMISNALSDDQQELISCKWRVFHDLARLALASRIYRASHHGELPASSSDFLPLISKWPSDTFDGNPLRYDRQKEVVYSVGENLKDDGGDISVRTGSPKDLGFSLRIWQDPRFGPVMIPLPSGTGKGWKVRTKA